MKTWLVDTNVLLDVIGADEQFGKCSRDLLAECAEAGTLIINPVIYAEVAVWIPTLEEINDLLPQDLFLREDIPWDAAFVAAQAFARYRRRGGRKPRMLADFLIGSHAAVSGHELITRDAGYATYFNLTLVDPVAKG